MYKMNRLVAAIITMLIVLTSLPGAYAQASAQDPKVKEASGDDNFDPIEFLNRFKLGMSYTEVQNLLPKNFDQDILSYITTDEVFLLNVDIPGRAGWNASFKFDTLDAAMRRPEQLVEVSCGAALSSRSSSFESLVRRVADVFGEPDKMDKSEDQIQQAGWRVSGGSVLTLEYFVVPKGLDGKDVSVDFVVKKNKRAKSSPSKDIA